MHYFDYTSTTKISENSLKTYIETSELIYGNPSSEHEAGIKAKQCLEKMRQEVSSLLKTKPENIFFTSGGTESDSIVIQSLLNNPVPGEIITTSIEHAAVLENKRILESHDWKFTSLKCPGGYLDTETLKNALNPKVRMVCIMKVNNVTGTILDTCNLIKIIREYEKSINRKIHIHCDSVQALGKIEFYPEIEDFDSAAFSSHKINGPRGTGILYNRNSSVLSLSKGGGQEKGMRPGTENLPAICAMVTAMKDAENNRISNFEKVSKMRNMVEECAVSNGYSLISPSYKSNSAYSPFILNISAKPIPSQVFLRMIGDKGFCMSAGSACSANSKGKAESVLSAMNVKPEDRQCSVRISFSGSTTFEEIELLCQALKEIKNGK